MLGGHDNDSLAAKINGKMNLDDMWKFNGGKWSFLGRLPTSRGLSAFASTYDSDRKVLFIMGGMSQQGTSLVSRHIVLNYFFGWDGSKWHEIISSTQPRHRRWSAIAYNPVNNKIVLFGGGDHKRELLSDTWEYGYIN